MVKVGGAVEQFHFADRLNGGNDLVNDLRPSRFGEVGNAFYELGHGVSWLGSFSILVEWLISSLRLDQ